MHAKIAYDSTVVVEDVLSSIVAVMTGETSTSNLSEGLKIGSEISAVYRPAGWELWDDVSSTVKVIRAPYTDLPGEYKYVRFEAVETTNDYISWDVYRDWDNSTHTGTLNRRISYNSVSNDKTYAFYRTAATVGIIYLSGSSKHMATLVSTDNNTKVTGMGFISERSRINEWDTPSIPHKPIAYSVKSWSGANFNNSTYTNKYMCNFETLPTIGGGAKDINSSTSSDTAWSMYTSIGSWFNGAYTGSGNMANTIAMPEQVMDSSFNIKRPVIGFGFGDHLSGYYGGDTSAASGIYLTDDSGLLGEAFSSGGFNYVVWQIPQSYTTTSGAPSTGSNSGIDNRVPRFIVLNG